MTATTVTAAGFTRQTTADTIAEITASVQAVYGADINVDPTTPDGQLIAAISGVVQDQAQALETVNASFDVRNAIGTALSGRIRLNGLERKPGTPSQVNFFVNGTAGKTVPIGARIEVDSTTVFATVASVTLTGAPISVLAVAETAGAVTVSGGSSLRILTPRDGWQIVVFDSQSVVGTPYETDPVAQGRRSASVAIASQTLVESMRAKVLAVPGVSQCFVYENTDDAAIIVGSTSVRGHAVFVVVNGGDDTAIAQAIALGKGGGHGMIGATSVDLVDSQGFTTTYKFSRPTVSYKTVSITIKRYKAGTTFIDGWPGDTAGTSFVKLTIQAYVNALGIGEPVNCASTSAAVIQAAIQRFGAVPFRIEAMSVSGATDESPVALDAKALIALLSSITVTLT